MGAALLSLPVPPEWRLRIPFLVAGGFSTLAWLFVLARLPEPPSRAAGLRESARALSWRGIVDTATLPGIGQLILIGFLAVLAFAAFESTFALYLRRRMGLDAQGAAFAFAGIGFWTALVQGGLIRRLVPRFGEVRLILAGLSLAACGFGGISLASNVLQLVGSLLLLGAGQGLLSPSVAGLISRLTPQSEQGAVFGTYSSAQTFARTVSYSLANVLLGKVTTAAPYLGSLGIDALALLLTGRVAARLGLDPAATSGATAEPKGREAVVTPRGSE
jgi:DHA1 family tetracycline resistance protein-like MFS transporter